MKLRFVSPSGGSPFLRELLGVVASEVDRLGPASPVGEVAIIEGPLPPADSEDVYVIVPQEYWAALPDAVPDREQLARTIGLCIGHPDDPIFKASMRRARRLAACLAADADSAWALNDLGVPTDRFVLGYSEFWDQWRGAISSRPLDVVCFGAGGDRPSRLLGLECEVLDDMNVRLETSPLSAGEDLHLLAESKILLNLHSRNIRSLEWITVLKAICNGCVVVSEHSSDVAPLIPGKHLVMGRPRTLTRLARSLLSDTSRLERLRADAYEMVRTQLPMRSSALLLAQLAADVAAGAKLFPTRKTWIAPKLAWPSHRAGLLADEGASGSSSLQSCRLDARPRLSASPSMSSGGIPVRSDRGPDSLDAVVVRSVGWPEVTPTLASLLPQLGGLDAGVHLCFDGEEPEDLKTEAKVVMHGGIVPSGVGGARNRALFASDAATFLVLDSMDRLAPDALASLREALHGGSAHAAYGMVVRADGVLASTGPFNPAQIGELDYLPTAALWRRAALVELGGWSDGADVEGSETWDLWRRLGAAGGSAVFVARPLVRQTFSQVPPPTALDVSPRRVPALLAQHFEFVSELASGVRLASQGGAQARPERR